MTSPGGELVRREDLLSGSLQSQRHAARVLGAIEARVLHMAQETRRAIDAYFFGTSSDYERKVDRGFLQSVLARARAEEDVTLADIERFAPQWRPLVPSDPRTRADLIHRLSARFGPALGAARATLHAVGADSPSVLAAFEAAFGGPPSLERSASPLSPSASNDAERSAEWLRVPGGEDIYREGDHADALYLVVNGHLRMLSGPAGDETIEWEYGRGDVAGEAEVLTGEPRSARLMAQRDAELIRVPQEAVLALARERPETMLRMNRALAQRIRGQTGASRVLREAQTFALLPAHDNAPLQAAGDGLMDALVALGDTCRVDRKALDAHLPEGLGFDEEAYEAEIIAWLSETETSHRYVIAQADRDPFSEWSRRCVRQADQAILVADATRTPDAATIDALASRLDSPPDLILVHPPGLPRPRGTRTWVKAVNPRFVYHWRTGDPSQAASIARRLTGQGIAVVLSGGAARGYAHIGAMQAIEQHDIPIDLIAGTSMGALVGAGFALGRDAADMRRRSMATAARRKLLDPTLPVAAFTAGGKITRLLQRETEGERIEDLWRPYFCVSSNLTRAAAQVHEAGTLWRAIRASIAIPGVFPPIRAANGDVLVDGAAVNNMPIDLVRPRADVGTIIAVNVAPLRDQGEAYEFGPTISGWAALLHKVRRPSGAPYAPGLVNTFMRTNEIRGATLLQSRAFTKLADLVIEPPVEQFPLLQFSLCPEIIDCGHEAASSALRNWLSQGGSATIDRLRGMERAP